MQNFFKYLLILSAGIFISACSTTDNIAQQNKEAANYNAQLGLAYLQQGNIPVAKNKILLAERQAPDDPLVLDSMAYFLEKIGETDAAERYYLQAIKYSSQDGAVQNNYGTFLCRQKRYRESLQHFMLAVRDIHYLNTAAAYVNASLCAAKIPDKKLAAEYLQKSQINNSNL
jgi:type IV pilus assembly protein PilF